MQHIYTSCHHIYLYRRRACMCCISRVALLNRLTGIKINSEPQTSIQIITVIIIVRWLLVIMKRRTNLNEEKPQHLALNRFMAPGYTWEVLLQDAGNDCLLLL